MAVHSRLTGITLTCQACIKPIKSTDPRMMYKGYLIHKWEKCTVQIDARQETEGRTEYNLGPQYKKRTGKTGTGNS